MYGSRCILVYWEGVFLLRGFAIGVIVKLLLGGTE
jgi:hypothetical protein